MRNLLVILLTFFTVSAWAQNTSPALPPTANGKKEKEWKKKKDKLVADQERKEKRAKKDLVKIQDKKVQKRMKRSKRKANRFNKQKHKNDK